MQVKYAILNPANGLYTYKDTYEEAVVQLAKQAVDCYSTFHCHGKPCSYVEVQDDGSEIWKNHDGAVVPSPAEIEKQAERLMAEMTRTYEDLPKVIL